MSQFEAVIGLEVHAQLKTNSKIFASSSTEAGNEPNTQTDPVTLGLPGALPVLNKDTVHCAIKLGLATDCQIRETSIFARKHYFYPDLPKGYQISQYDKPICEHGKVSFRLDDKDTSVGITRIHMEEDAGKSSHLENEPYSVVDLNRAGVPLLEIVSEPDIRSSQEAGAYLRRLRQIVRYIDVCDGNMDEGSLRCDANISVRPIGREKFGTKVEIKNLNSFRYVEKAIDFEIDRQIAVIQQGGEIVQETRLWDEAKSITKSMRSKEHAEDYRYFPDPDLLPLVVDEQWIEDTKSALPELPNAALSRFCQDYGLDMYLSEILTEEKETADFFDTAASSHNNHTALANWITSELFGRLKKENKTVSTSPVSARNLARLVQLIDEKVISGKIAKSVFDEMFKSGGNPDDIVESKGLVQITDEGQISSVIEKIISSNPGQVEAYKGGKNKLFGFFVGQTMKETQGKANPEVVNKLLKDLLAR